MRYKNTTDQHLTVRLRGLNIVFEPNGECEIFDWLVEMLDWKIKKYPIEPVQTNTTEPSEPAEKSEPQEVQTTPAPKKKASKKPKA